MAITDRTGCEVRIDSTWQLMPLAEAHAQHGAASKRCPLCHGQVALLGDYKTRPPTFRLQHRKAHDGCLLIPRQYAGAPKPHPQALA